MFPRPKKIEICEDEDAKLKRLLSNAVLGNVTPKNLLGRNGNARVDAEIRRPF
jgi:hypothetical protein